MTRLKKLKRIAISFIFCSMCFTLMNCSNNEKDPSNTEDTGQAAEQQETVQTTEPNKNYSVVYNKCELRYERFSMGPYIEPKAQEIIRNEIVKQCLTHPKFKLYASACLKEHIYCEQCPSSNPADCS